MGMKKVNVSGGVSAAGELQIEMTKTPDMPGIVSYKARVLVGEEVKGLGSLDFDEDDVKERGHADVRAEVEAWAKEQAAKKGIPL